MNPTHYPSQLSGRRLAAGLLAALLVPALAPVRARAQAAADQPPAAANGDQTPAAAPAPAATPTPAETTSSSTSTPEKTIVLSPFEVSASQSQGYLTTNTLAGTRLNTNIGDLAGSITVVTKAEMEDTNSFNLNDVFRFEANTEGASTYTPIALVRGNVVDSLSGVGGPGSFSDALDNGARIRGLSQPDNEQNNFFSLARIPFDAYNTASVEIDRGPNSIIFGTGSPAGIVNQTTNDAVLDKFSGEASLMGGSWGTFRETFDVNIPLIKDTLAIYIAQLYNSQGFEQKPSSDITRREYGAIT
jgi:outer membrane receptor for ferric coprogen and ferric-rhodotorulic acid